MATRRIWLESVNVMLGDHCGGSGSGIQWVGYILIDLYLK